MCQSYFKCALHAAAHVSSNHNLREVLASSPRYREGSRGPGDKEGLGQSLWPSEFFPLPDLNVHRQGVDGPSKGCWSRLEEAQRRGGPWGES